MTREYLQDPKDSIKKLQELINEFGKVAGYKINIQKSVAFLYVSNELSEREIKTVPFTVASKRIKQLGVNLTKGIKYLYSDNYKTLKKKIEEERNKWKHIPRSWIGRIDIVKMSMLPRAICRCNAIAIKIPMSYFTDPGEIFQKFISTTRGPA